VTATAQTRNEAAGSPRSAGDEALLSVENLNVSFATPDGRVSVVEDVSFHVRRGEALGLVGESGCGKSVTAMSLMRLLPSPPSFVDSGRIVFDGSNLLDISESRMRALRGDRIGMIFQEPMTSLNPVYTVAYQITETLRIHWNLRGEAALARARELLQMVGIGAPDRRLRQYPHELSGGLRQRIMIAIALACEPDLLIADEPTTALDVTIQAQILKLLDRLRRELGMAVLLITHDLGVVAQTCDRVEVMYAGRIVDRSEARELFRHPRHPYTQGLLASSPHLGKKQARLPTIPGVVPQPGERGPGCYFAGRCPNVMDRCHKEIPPLAPSDRPDHDVACWNPVQ